MHGVGSVEGVRGRRRAKVQAKEADPAGWPPKLHQLETEVMNEVWAAEGAVTVREARSSLNARNPRRQRAYTTVMTIMARLSEKGLLARELHGRTYHYRPVLDAEQYEHARAAARVSELVGDYGDLALAQGAHQIDQLGEDRLEQLRRLAEEEPDA